MKLLYSIIVLLFSSLVCHSQGRLDTSWSISKYKFSASFLTGNVDNSTEGTLSLFQDNRLILVDSIYVSRKYYEFTDINADGFVDLKVFCCSGARANEFYYLYLFNTKTKGYIKVDGFEDWPNLDTAQVKGLLVATVLTGAVTYKFFQLTNTGQLIDLETSIDDNNLDGKEYNTGIRLAKKKMQKQ